MAIIELNIPGLSKKVLKHWPVYSLSWELKLVTELFLMSWKGYSGHYENNKRTWRVIGRPACHQVELFMWKQIKRTKTLFNSCEFFAFLWIINSLFKSHLYRTKQLFFHKTIKYPIKHLKLVKCHVDIYFDFLLKYRDFRPRFINS